MEYQAWLGGLDRPYVRPRCMAFQPIWLEKKRHQLKRPDLQGPETPLERYVLEWEQKFFSFRGTLRPTADDLHTAFDLVERPLDLSYAIQVLHWCRNENDIHFARESFDIFVEACVRVDRIDVARFAMENVEDLGFWHVAPATRAFVDGKAPNPLDEADASTTTSTTAVAADAQQRKQAPAAATVATARATTDEAASDEAALMAELAALEEEERQLAAASAAAATPSKPNSGGGSSGKSGKKK